MCFVHEVLEIIGSALSWTCGEIARNMITKGAIVGVFLNSHQLNTIVAAFNDMGQDLISKFPVLSHSQMLRTHSDVRLVYLQVFRDLTYSWVLKLISRLEMLSIEQVCLFVLNYIASPGWITIHLYARKEVCKQKSKHSVLVLNKWHHKFRDETMVDCALNLYYHRSWL